MNAVNAVNAAWQRLRAGAAFGQVSRLAGASAAAQLIQLAATPLLTRWFDVAAIGAWTLFTATAATLATLATARYEFAIVLPRRHAEAALVLQLCLAVSAGVTLATAFGVFVWQALWPGSLAVQSIGLSLAWLPLAVAGAGATQALTLWHNRQRGFGAIAQARVATPLAVTLLQFGAAAARLGAPGLMAAQALGALAGPAALAWAARDPNGRWPRLPRWSARRLARVARRYRQFPLLNTPHAFVNALQEPLAIGVVAVLAGPVAAGHFGLTMRLLRAPAALLGRAVSEVLLGALARTWHDGGDIRPLMARATRSLALASLLPALALLAAGPWLFGFVLGADWAEAGAYARWLVPYLVAHFIVGPLTVAPIVMDRQGTALAFSVVGNGLYVGALAAMLAAGSGMAPALAVLSALQALYFAAFWAWLWRAARPRGAAHG